MVHKRAPQSIENFSIAHDSFDHEFDDWNFKVVATRDTCTGILIFVCLWFFVSLENFSLICRLHHDR